MKEVAESAAVFKRVILAGLGGFFSTLPPPSMKETTQREKMDSRLPAGVQTTNLKFIYIRLACKLPQHQNKAFAHRLTYTLRLNTAPFPTNLPLIFMFI